MCSGSLGPHPIAALLGFLAPAFVGGVGIGGSPATGSGAAHYGRAGSRPHRDDVHLHPAFCGPPGPKIGAAVASSCATSMGIQNATARRLAELDLTTTVMTMAATLIAFSRDEVTSFDRHIGGLVSKNALLDLPVGFGRAGILAQVFGPRLHEKALDVSPGLRDVLEQKPPRCPVASPQPTEICHSAAERVGLGGIDPIGDLHQDWALLGLGGARDVGRRPERRRMQVECLA